MSLIVKYDYLRFCQQYRGAGTIVSMYFLYYGNDTTAVRTAAQQKVEAAQKEGKTINRIDADAYQPGVIADALGAVSLFGESELYLFDVPSSDKAFEDDVFEHLAALGDSDNQFLIIEEGLLSAPKKKYEKHAASSEEFKAAKAERFNTFAMADALAGKDKRRLWLLLQEAKQNGLAAEEVIGVLWWQLKSLRLAANTKSAAEAGMKDFPYNKAKRALTKFSSKDLNNYSSSLLTLYHQGHSGKSDINDALEHWVLAFK